MIEMQWKIFGWIMSFTDSIVSLIRQLPKEYKIIGATLYALVKVKLISWKLSLQTNTFSLKTFFLRYNPLISLIQQNGFLDVKTSDGILYTANKVYSKNMGNVTHPDALVAAYVRAAHIYNIAFSDIRQNFAIAGLLKFIQVRNKF